MNKRKEVAMNNSKITRIMKAYDFAEYIMNKVPSSIIEDLSDEMVDKLWKDYSSNPSDITSNNNSATDARFAELLESEGSIEEYVLIDPSKPEGERYSIYNGDPNKAPKGNKVCCRNHKFTGKEQSVNYIVPVIENGSITGCERHSTTIGSEIPTGAITYTKSFVNEYKKCSKKCSKKHTNGNNHGYGKRYITEDGMVYYKSKCVEIGLDCLKLLPYSQKHHSKLTKAERAALARVFANSQFELF